MYQLILEENVTKKNKTIVWDDECEETFRKLKEICISTTILPYADFSKLFKFHTDACNLGLGAILYQNQDGVDYIIGYVNRSLSKTAHRYLAHKLEFLALIWAIMEQFHEYLYGNNCVVYTDSNLLTYMLTTEKLDATGHCGVASLVNYNCALSYQLGNINVDADALSHIPRGKQDQCIEAASVHDLISQMAYGTTLMEV